jgi:hypothetical protein
MSWGTLSKRVLELVGVSLFGAAILTLFLKKPGVAKHG